MDGLIFRCQATM